MVSHIWGYLALKKTKTIESQVGTSVVQVLAFENVGVIL